MSQKPNKPIDISDEDMMGEIPIEEIKTDIKPKEETPAGLIDSPTRAELEEKLTKTEQELTAANDRTLRTLADIENIRRRAERDVSDAHRYGVKKLLEELIPVLDSFEQSVTSVSESDHELVKNMRHGMILTLQMLQKILEKFGVKEINPLKEMFNPAFHEVMLAQENNDVAPNTILAVMQKGYILHDRVIRPARVMIAKMSG